MGKKVVNCTGRSRRVMAYNKGKNGDKGALNIGMMVEI
jgi:hypothetical protein